MKKLLYCVCLLSSSLFALAQNTYYEMLHPTNEWNITYYGCGSWTSCYVPDRDTVFNGTTYKVISNVGSSYAIAYLREDVVNEQIFSYEPSNNTETLAFDFKLEVGDVYTVTTLWEATYEATVISTDQIQLLDGGWRKRITLSAVAVDVVGMEPENWVWIEGLGAVGSFNKFDSGQVNCFHSKNTLIWHSGNEHHLSEDETECSCPEPTTTMPIELVAGNTTLSTPVNIKVYPNPTNQYLFIELNETKAVDIEVAVVNANGQIVAQYLPSSNLAINTQQWASGIYWVNVNKGKQRLHTEKIIKP